MSPVLAATGACWEWTKKEGEFARYKDNRDATLRAILHCGGCPGMAPVNRLANLKVWMAPMGETIDKIHIGTCLIKYCPYKDSILQKVKKARVEVIEGTHYYAPPTIFGSYPEALRIISSASAEASATSGWGSLVNFCR